MQGHTTNPHLSLVLLVGLVQGVQIGACVPEAQANGQAVVAGRRVGGGGRGEHGRANTGLVFQRSARYELSPYSVTVFWDAGYLADLCVTLGQDSRHPPAEGTERGRGLQEISIARHRDARWCLQGLCLGGWGAFDTRQTCLFEPRRPTLGGSDSPPISLGPGRPMRLPMPRTGRAPCRPNSADSARNCPGLLGTSLARSARMLS